MQSQVLVNLSTALVNTSVSHHYHLSVGIHNTLLLQMSIHLRVYLKSYDKPSRNLRT